MGITIFVQSHLSDGLQLAHGLCQIIEVGQNLLKRRLLVFGDFPVSRNVEERVLDLSELFGLQALQQLDRHAVNAHHFVGERMSASNRALV